MWDQNIERGRGKAGGNFDVGFIHLHNNMVEARDTLPGWTWMNADPWCHCGLLIIMVFSYEAPVMQEM